MMFLPYHADAIAETIYAHIDRAVQERGHASLAIPGGRSPGPVLTALATLLEPYFCERLHLLWVDERAVPVGHSDRCDAATLAAWQAGGALPGHVHSMPAEADDLAAAAVDYAATLRRVTGDGVIDVCLLGIGEDGHIASLFPEHPGLAELAEVIVVEDSPKPPPRRMSLTLPVLARARQRLVLALGAAKGAITKRIADGERGPQLPVSLLPEEGTFWYCDPAASAGLAS